MSQESVTFGLVHGAWHGAWCWNKLNPELEARGHEVVAADLPIDDPNSTFDDHAEIVTDSLRGKENIVLVGHSRGGNIIPRVAGIIAVEKMIFLCGAFHATLTEEQSKEGQNAPPSAMPEFTSGIIPVGNNLATYDAAKARDIFYQDCSEEDATWAIGNLRLQRRAVEGRLQTWPDVLAEYVLCQEDRVISPEWSRFAARQWLDVEAIEIPGGHSPFLSRPELLADTLVSLVD